MEETQVCAVLGKGAALFLPLRGGSRASHRTAV